MLRHISGFQPFGSKILKAKEEEIKTILHDDGMEISWYKNDVIWSQNRCLLHELTLPGDVRKCVICNIDNNRHLAVLYESGLTLFSITGQTYLVPLPFQIASIYPLHKSLLIVRAHVKSIIHPQLKDFPILFTLFHPLEEIRPVALKSVVPRSPKPRFTTIPSPSPRKQIVDFPRTPVKDDNGICFIVDDAFCPLHVSNERKYILAQTDEQISVWKISESTESRDILFSSPHFKKLPSIFSPKKPYQGLMSPGSIARDDIKATLEGIPPDLYMDYLMEFTASTGDEPTSFCEISDGRSKYLLFVHCGILEAIDISGFEVTLTQWAEDVKCICYYKELMYFAIYKNGTMVLHEENRAIVSFELSDVSGITKLGHTFVIDFNNGTSERFTFTLAKSPVVRKILKAAHDTIEGESYASTVLALSSSDKFATTDSFVESFIDIICQMCEQQQIEKFFTALHGLYEDLKIQKDSEDDQKVLLKLLVPIASKLGYANHLLYYALKYDGEIKIDEESKFQGDVIDLMSWCALCVAGIAVVDLPLSNKLAEKIVSIFSEIQKAENPQSIVIQTEKSGLKLNEIKRLKPAIAAPLLRAFELTADCPPENWPIEAYRLIGRDDIAKTIECIRSPAIDERVKEIDLPDLRFLEVERLLQSHLPITVDVERPNGTDDIVYQSMMVAKLKSLLQKQYGLSVGRGLFNYSTFLPMPSQSLETHPLNEKGFTTNGLEIIDTDDQTTNTDVASSKLWAEFHNGASDSIAVVDASHSWITDFVVDMTPYNAGVLFGFAVNGLLKKLWKTEIYQYLTAADIKDVNAIAMLFGLGLSYRGTKDLGISHMLTMHCPQLRQFEQEDAEFPLLINAAAVFGIGFVYEGSGNRHITEAFVTQLENAAAYQTKSIIFAFGAAVGLVNLGMGDSSPVMKEVREQLTMIFNGHKTEGLKDDNTATFGNSDYYNVAPASLLALILGYMRTDSERVKNALQLPHDSSYINILSPDVVLMRVMGALLVDSDPSTAANIAIPEGLDPEILASYITGFAIACGIKYAGTMNKKSYDRLVSVAKCLALFEKKPFDFTECSAKHRERCLASVVLACSLIIAGTCDINFLRFVRMIRRRPILSGFQDCSYGLHMHLGMAVGVLCLGKGRFTLGRTNEASAAILIAMYPRFPEKASDNEYIFQPVRHLIGAAIVPRVLEVRDVDTNEITNLFITIHMGEESFVIHTPHVLPPYSDINGITIDDPRYYTVSYEEFPFKDENVRPIIYVKKRSVEPLPRPSDAENLRAFYKMRSNPVFQAKQSEEDDSIRIKLELDWDAHQNEIIEYFRCTDNNERLRILQNSPSIKSFLEFFGIPPSIVMPDIGLIENDALAFIIPLMTSEEIENVL